MIFCVLSVTNHLLTSFPIREGVLLTEDTFIISASSRSSKTSGVATRVPTPTPDPDVETESAERNDLDNKGDDPPVLPLVLTSSPKFNTSRFVDDEGESSGCTVGLCGDPTSLVEKLGDSTDDTGDVGGVGADGIAGVTDTLFMQMSSLYFFEVDMRRFASTGVSR